MIERIAELLHVSEWDWIAIIIALISLGIAIASMIFAKRTLKSQRQTEINTTPIIKSSIQEFLLKEILVKVFDGYMRLTSLKYLYNKEKYKSYVSEEKLMDLKIDTNNIHVELFFSDEVKYRCMQGLLDITKAFNSRIDVCISHFKDSQINASLLENEVTRLINKSANIVSTWNMVMSLVYDYNDFQKRDVLDNVVKRIDTIANEEVKSDNYYDIDNAFSLFYDTLEQKNMLVSFMNQYTAAVTSDFSALLIVR